MSHQQQGYNNHRGGRGHDNRSSQNEQRYSQQQNQQNDFGGNFRNEQYFDQRQFQHQQDQSQQLYYYPQQSYGQQQFYPPGYQDQSEQQTYYPPEFYPQHQEFVDGSENQGVYNQQGYVESDEAMFDEIEREMGLVPPQTRFEQRTGNNNDGASFLPHGAMPSVNGKLTKSAAEFWFPDCRNCECCAGYKHGCKCCANGVTECSCSSANIEESSKTTEHTSSVPSSSKSNVGNIPSSAVPTIGGQLTSAAAEFWFPESRNCECCAGYKHGCKCCTGGVTVCHCGEKVTVSSSISAPNTDAVLTNNSEDLSKKNLWFNECKKCSCCKGYVHDCDCVNTRNQAECSTCKRKI